MSDGTSVTAERLELPDESKVFEARTNDLRRGNAVTVRSGRRRDAGAAARDAVLPDSELRVRRDAGDRAARGVPVARARDLGVLKAFNGGRLDLGPGSYTFCSVKAGRDARIAAGGPVTLNVDGSVRLGADSHLEPEPGEPPLVVNVSGRKIKFTQNAVVRAVLTVPNA